MCPGGVAQADLDRMSIVVTRPNHVSCLVACHWRSGMVGNHPCRAGLRRRYAPPSAHTPRMVCLSAAGQVKSSGCSASMIRVRLGGQPWASSTKGRSMGVGSISPKSEEGGKSALQGSALNEHRCRRHNFGAQIWVRGAEQCRLHRCSSKTGPPLWTSGPDFRPSFS